MQKWILLSVVLLNGGWMIIDGTHVLLKGRFIGPSHPGPWSHLVTAVGIDPFRLGTPFILLGMAWLGLFGLLFVVGGDIAWLSAMGIAHFILWYIPVGTILSLIAILFLFRYKEAYV